MILRLHHVNITIPVADVEQARQFYCGVLGLAEIPKPNSLAERGGFWLKLANLDIHVSVEDGINRHATKAHLAYEVENLTVMRAKIEAVGLPIKESTPIPGFARFECRDPFGNRVEFIQPLLENVE